MEKVLFTILTEPEKRSADESEVLLGDALSAGAPWYDK